MGLTDLISVIPPGAEEELEDIFAAAPGLIFTDDLRTQHGDLGETIIYKSSRFGNIELKTADPKSESDRRLFAHYLWNAGIKLAELISEKGSQWDVAGKRVLELGAGVGLDGIVATLAGASEVLTTDYPAAALLENLRRNVRKATSADAGHRVRIDGYEWGDTASQFALENASSFDIILAADCYWMPHEHENLVRSMLWLLATSPDAKVFVVSGFHTGRAKLAGFFDEAIAQGLVIDDIYEEDAEGNQRPWAKERDGGTENVTERKKWLVVAVLKRRSCR